MAVTTLDGDPVAVTGGQDGTVRVWDLRAGAARGAPLRGHTGTVSAVAVGEVDGTPAVASGDDNGSIMIWALDFDQRPSARLDAPAGITAIVFASQVGWLTSTKDGSLFIWRPEPVSGYAPQRLR